MGVPPYTTRGDSALTGAELALPLSGPTSERPALPRNGFLYFDTDVGLPIYWNGTAWVNALGAATNPHDAHEATGTLQVGGYAIFVDIDGGLKIMTPDATIIPLVDKT